MNTTSNWDLAFEQFNKLGLDTRISLRHNCASFMEMEGATEIGSSDVNHRLFALYNINNQSWQAVIAYLLDYSQ